MGESPSGVFSVERLGAICHIAFDPSETQCIQALAQSARMKDTLRGIDQDVECEVLILSGLVVEPHENELLDSAGQSSVGPRHSVADHALELFGGLRPLTVTVVTDKDDQANDDLRHASDLVLAIERSANGRPRVKWAACPGRGGAAKLSAIVGRFNEMEPDILQALASSTAAEPYALRGTGGAPNSSNAFAW